MSQTVVDLLSPAAPTPLYYLTKEETTAIIKVHFECYDVNSEPQAAADHLYGCLISAQMTKELSGKVDLAKYGVTE